MTEVNWNFLDNVQINQGTRFFVNGAYCVKGAFMEAVGFTQSPEASFKRGISVMQHSLQWSEGLNVCSELPIWGRLTPIEGKLIFEELDPEEAKKRLIAIVEEYYPRNTPNKEKENVSVDSRDTELVLV